MNNQQVGKLINFYRINHSFHPPYNFVLDGNFIKLIVEKEIDFKRKLENALDAKVKLKVTTCIIREL